PAERTEGVVLRLLHRGFDPPVPDVAVAPLRADREGPGRAATGPEPRGHEFLGPAVRTGGVDVADPGLERLVEDRVSVPLDGLDAPIGSQVLLVAEVDVGRPPQSREAQSDGRDGQARPPERPGVHGGSEARLQRGWPRGLLPRRRRGRDRLRAWWRTACAAFITCRWRCRPGGRTRGAPSTSD